MGRREELQRLLGELRVVQDSYRGRRMPEKVGRDFERLSREAEALQQRVDAESGAWQEDAGR